MRAIHSSPWLPKNLAVAIELEQPMRDANDAPYPTLHARCLHYCTLEVASAG